MASFDIITVISLAYKKVWLERRYLLPMMAIPFLVKLACFAALSTFVEDDGLWLAALILLPSFFVEGWLLSHWARTVMTGTHRWPFRSTGNEMQDRAEMASRSKGIMAGTVTYVLINFLMAGYFAAMFSSVPDLTQGLDPQNPDPHIAMVGIIFMVSALLLFRFVWVYIPLAVNLPLEKILEKLKPMRLTFQMIGLWLVCVVPAILALQVLGEGLSVLSADGDVTAVQKTGFMVARIAIDMIKNLICTAGMAYAFLALFKNAQK